MSRASLSYTSPVGQVVMEREGDGRYTAFVVAAPGQGRVRVGTVLGSGRLWVAELIGRKVSLRAPSRPRLATAIGVWASAQPGFALASAGTAK